MKTIRFTAYPDGYRCSEPGDQSGEYVKADDAFNLLYILKKLHADSTANDFNEHWESYTVAESMIKRVEADGKPKPMNAEDLATLPAIGEQIRTQDNRITMNPMFCVQQRRGKHWETVMVAFTQKGCEEYLRQDGHNLHKPRIYVMSFNRCPEMIAIREFLMTL